MSKAPLTRDDVLAMLAGREMDAIIQERVFRNQILGLARCWNEDGWMVMGEPEGTDTDRPCFLWNCLCDLDDDEPPEWFPRIYGHLLSCLRIVPAYSTDIAAAWEVVEHFAGPARNRRCIIVSIIEPDEWNCEIGAADDASLDSLCADGPTPMLAICRAALLSTL